MGKERKHLKKDTSFAMPCCTCCNKKVLWLTLFIIAGVCSAILLIAGAICTPFGVTRKKEADDLDASSDFMTLADGCTVTATQVCFENQEISGNTGWVWDRRFQCYENYKYDFSLTADRTSLPESIASLPENPSSGTYKSKKVGGPTSGGRCDEQGCDRRTNSNYGPKDLGLNTCYAPYDRDALSSVYKCGDPDKYCVKLFNPQDDVDDWSGGGDVLMIMGIVCLSVGGALILATLLFGFCYCSEKKKA